MKKNLALAALVGLGLAFNASSASAVLYHYVDWTSADPGAGTATGTITLPDSSTVTVDFEVLNQNGSAGSYFFAQTGPSTNYWAPNGGAPFLSTEVSNIPPDSDILALQGGLNQTYKITLSEAIKDPIMAIVSLGTPSAFISYDFDTPFDIVSQGPGAFGGTSSSLQKLPGDVLLGNEGHGTIQFDGTYSEFSWTAPFPETWHGFTYGIRTTEAIEPTTISEPAMFGLFGLGLAGLGYVRRRRSAA